jgi:hypothetical protein
MNQPSGFSRSDDSDGGQDSKSRAAFDDRVDRRFHEVNPVPTPIGRAGVESRDWVQFAHPTIGRVPAVYTTVD